MNHTIPVIDDLTTKTPNLVGRQKELDRIKKCLYARGDRHFLYYYAGGGLGKTRLLEEVQRLVAEAGSEYASTGIIDLYHTDTHATSDVERIIVNGLDPAENYFHQYRVERKIYEHLRERGTDPQVLEDRRHQLSQLFVAGCREMALEMRKLVICFDTIEMLQYESSAVETVAGLETVDARLKPWLIEHLSKLANVLVIFAGRPKLSSPGETTDHQQRLIGEMKLAFGKDFFPVALAPFTLDETKQFVQELAAGDDIIPQADFPIVHQLTGGRPIFLHLIVDLLRTLSPEPRRILEQFQDLGHLANEPEGSQSLSDARTAIEREILNSLFNNTGETGGYLARIALMPKGIDREILKCALGLPTRVADELLRKLAPLSFVKRFNPLPGTQQIHGERLFLHDEMYQLLRKVDVIPYLRITERQIAHGLEESYYRPQIHKLEKEADELKKGGESLRIDDLIPLRERLDKMRVERLYYLLARDPALGYEEYKRLSDEANRQRRVGYGMRLLDEFLRFYNDLDRREQLNAAGIPHEQVIRESAGLWVERFHWWAQYGNEIRFAQHVLDHPEDLYLRQVEDVGILGNICALWARACAILNGYNAAVVEAAQAMLQRLPTLEQSSLVETLARARLETSIGFQYRYGAELPHAVRHNVEAIKAFRTLDTREDELAIVLNNLAVVYAKQGYISQARILAQDALRIDETLGDDYTTGLTLTVLGAVERTAGNFPEAIQYGEEALEKFTMLDDPYGRVRAYYGIAFALRRMAKRELQHDRRRPEAKQKLHDAQHKLETALDIATKHALKAELPELHAELGKVFRELGRVISITEGTQAASAPFRQGEHHLNNALQDYKNRSDQAMARQDLAELYFVSHDPLMAEQELEHVESLIGTLAWAQTGDPRTAPSVQNEDYLPLGKVYRLRGEIAFDEHKPVKALQNYAYAFAFFTRFSPNSVEKETMLQPMYDYLRALKATERQNLEKAVRAWAAELQNTIAEVNIKPFVDMVSDFAGI